MSLQEEELYVTLITIVCVKESGCRKVIGARVQV